MPSDTHNASRLNITQENVMRIITRIIEVDGLEAAKAAFKQMNEFFSGIQGWAETTEAVYALLSEKRKEQTQQLHEERLEEQRAAAPHIHVLNQANNNAKNIGTAEIDEMKVDVNSPGNNVARFIKIVENDAQ